MVLRPDPRGTPTQREWWIGLLTVVCIYHHCSWANWGAHIVDIRTITNNYEQLRTSLQYLEPQRVHTYSLHADTQGQLWIYAEGWNWTACENDRIKIPQRSEFSIFFTFCMAWQALHIASLHWQRPATHCWFSWVDMVTWFLETCNPWIPVKTAKKWMRSFAWLQSFLDGKPLVALAQLQFSYCRYW